MINIEKNNGGKELNTNERENMIRDGLKKYIDENFLNLDPNLVIDMLSDIFKINVLILEIINENGTIRSSIKCNNINKKTGLINIDFNKYCILLKIKDIYQPLVMYDDNKSKMFKIIFNLEDDLSNSNISQLYNKCLLKYKNNSYKKLLINSIYNNIDITNYLILNDDHLIELLKLDIDIKYVVDINFMKVGILLSYKELDDLFIPINNLKHNINYLSTLNNKKINNVWLKNLELNNILKDFDTTLNLINKYLEIHQNELLNINRSYITHMDKNKEYVIGIGLKINEYIPIIKKEITDIKLKKGDKLIGYINNINNVNKDISILKNLKNDNINTTIYYRNFLEFISNNIELQIIDRKNLENNIDKDLKIIKDYLKNILESLIHKVDDIDDMNMIEAKNNNYELNNLDDMNKFMITDELYDLFLNYLIYDLKYNNFRRNQILNNLFTKNIILQEDDTSTILDTKTITNETIYELYNNILSDKYTHLLGNKYISKKKAYNKNTIYCTKKIQIEDDEGEKYIYYNFKKLLKNNDISYSNCIYYYIGKNILKLENNIIKNTRELISLQIKKILENNSLILNNDNFDKIDLSSIINLYTEESQSNLYNNIQTIDDLIVILNSDEHWITYFDLLMLVYLKENILVKIMYSDKNNKIIDTFINLKNSDKPKDLI